MADKEIAVKKYVVKLSDDEREQLNSLIRGGKHAARKLLSSQESLASHTESPEVQFTNPCCDGFRIRDTRSAP